MIIDDNMRWMTKAIDQANYALKKDEVPIGAVIVKDNKIIGKGYNKVESLKDSTAHAEILVIRNACKTLKTTKLFDFSLFTTLEPCAMCAMAISLVGIKNLYFATEDKKKGCVENGIRIFSSNSCHHEPNVFNGFYKKESEVLLKKFFSQRR